MNRPRSILINRHRFHKDIVFIILRVSDINKLKKLILCFENVRVVLFADFALKLLPKVACHIFTKLFYRLLSLNPILQTEKVYQTH